MYIFTFIFIAIIIVIIYAMFFEDRTSYWKHDVKEKTILQKTRGGLIMRRGKKPLWGMR